MDIKRTSVNDIYQSIPKGQDLQELYKNLREKLGDSNPFAKFDIGNGFYVWSHPSGLWQCLADANSVEQEMANNAIVELHKRVAQKVGEKTADAIFTVPDESYIFFNNEDGDIKLIERLSFRNYQFKVSASLQIFECVVLANFEVVEVVESTNAGLELFQLFG